MKSSSIDNINVFYRLQDGSTEASTANTNDLLMEETNNFSGWECWAGIQNITIDNKGDVWRAICRQGEKLGSIFTDFDVAQDTVVCNKTKCTCAADLLLSKARPEATSLLRVGQLREAEKSFCVVPWIQISTKTNGMYRACCLMSNMPSGYKGILTDGSGSPLRAGQHSFERALNSPEIKSLRQRMLKGERPEECKTCWSKEDVGLKSKRTVTNREFKKVLDLKKALRETKSDGGYEGPPAYFDLRFGNLCNIKCIMCHPASSSRWYDDYRKLYNTDTFSDGGEKVSLSEKSENYNWHSSETFWKNLEDGISGVRQIYLVGGEPLLIERHYDFLKYCISTNVAKDIVLEYDTNLTLLKGNVLELWSQFKKVLLRISIEDVGERNNYIRFPSKWNIILNNLEQVKQSGANIEISFSITWQLLNCLSVVDLWKRLGGVYSTRILSSPAYFDVAILPRKIKELAIERLYIYQNEFGDPKVNSFIQYLEKNMDRTDPQLLREAHQFIKKLDDIRGTHFETTFPELAELLEEYVR